MRTKLLSVLALALVLSVGANAQEILAGWTFNDTVGYLSTKKDTGFYADLGLEDNVKSKFIAAMDESVSWSDLEEFLPVEFKNGEVKYSGWNDGQDKYAVSIQFYTAQATDLNLTFKIASGGESKEEKRAPKDWKVQIENADGDWDDLKTIELTDYNFQTISIDLPADYNGTDDKISMRWLMTSNTAVGGTTVTAEGNLKMDSVIVSGVVPTIAADDFAAEAVSVYPNPATDVVNVIGADVVEIINAVGVVVKSVVGESVISVADLNAGIYFVKTEETLTKLVIE